MPSRRCTGRDGGTRFPPERPGSSGGDPSLYDESVGPVAELVQSAAYQVEEAIRLLGRYRDELEFEPDRLNQVEERLDLIHRLKRKYGDTIEAVLAYGKSVAEELEELKNRDENREEVKRKLEAVREKLESAARRLTTARKKAAERLERRMEEELSDLNMANTTFRVSFQPAEQGFTPTGCDRVEFQIAPNPGEPLRPLAKIASGGELSRLMLALKTIFIDVDPIGTVVFDEIDTGVSGRAAQSIAEKMAALARKNQVLCVTHCPRWLAWPIFITLLSRRFPDKRRGRGSSDWTPRAGRRSWRACWAAWK